MFVRLIMTALIATSLMACTGDLKTRVGDLSSLAGPPDVTPTPTPVPIPPTPIPTPPIGKAGYPFYMPMDNLIETPQYYFDISCNLSNAAGELRTKDNKPVTMPNAAVYTGVTFVYEAPCTYTNISPAEIRNWKWAAGAQVIHRTSVRGQKAKFITNNPWGTLHIGPGGIVGYKLDGAGLPTGAVGGRFHAEITDIEFYNTSADPETMAALWFEVFPTADSGSLATLVVRDSKFSGGKNAMIVPGGAVMVYAENTEFSRNHGTDMDQQHGIYINGSLITHFKNVKVFGQRASGDTGGHQLKVKSGIVVLEDVTLSNAGGDYDPSNRPLYDGASQAYVWSENLNLNRITAINPRDTLVDLRRNAYTSSRLKWPMETAVGADMGVAAPGCSKVKPEYEEYYMQVFKNTVVNSEMAEKSIFRESGFYDTIINATNASPDPVTPYSDVMANPRRNRAWLFTFNTKHTADVLAQDAYFFAQPSIPTYHCEDPVLPAGVQTLVNDKDKFITYAIKRFEKVNPKMYPITH